MVIGNGTSTSLSIAYYWRFTVTVALLCRDWDKARYSWELEIDLNIYTKVSGVLLSTVYEQRHSACVCPQHWFASF